MKIEDFKPSYVWPNPAFHFRIYYQSDRCRIFIIENITHNWNWLKENAQFIGENDYFFVSLGWGFTEYLVWESDLVLKTLELKKENFIVMCNDFASLTLFQSYGFRSEIINHNCFLDYNKFPILNVEKIYNAIYVARLVPFKRHELASKVNKLALIAGNAWGSENDFIPNNIFINDRQLTSEEVHNEISKSKVGIILSELEGACYSSSEYLISGLPVVSTWSYGGRDVWYNDYNSIISEPSPEAVSENVERIISLNRDPIRIRNMHIQQSLNFRKVFMKLHAEILNENNDNNIDVENYFYNNFKHKLLTSETPNFQEIFPRK